MNSAALWLRARNAYHRRAALWFACRQYTLPAGPPCVSFTFDDFPRSAWLHGGGILQEHGARGTYYTALGLADSRQDGIEYFHSDDLARLLEAGHELGCHTFDHCPAWETGTVSFERSVRRNAIQLHRRLPMARFRTLSYPISYPRPLTKRRLSWRFDCCRGGGQTFNQGTVDLNYLSAFFLEQSRDRPEAIEAIIQENARAGGWLIFATHDVTERPSRFGCTPALFARIVRAAANSGAALLPVHAAWQQIRARAVDEP